MTDVSENIQLHVIEEIVGVFQLMVYTEITLGTRMGYARPDLALRCQKMANLRCWGRRADSRLMVR